MNQGKPPPREPRAIFMAVVLDPGGVRAYFDPTSKSVVFALKMPWVWRVGGAIVFFLKAVAPFLRREMK